MDRIDPTFDPARPQANPAQPETQPAPPQPSAETFCTYLAKQFIAKKGFEVARIPEVTRSARSF
jgi:hypothetical protein